jgi:hypothetical protein
MPRYEIQHYFRLNTEINFGQSTFYTFEKYINDLAKDHKGTDIKFGIEEYVPNSRDKNTNESIFISFEQEIDAQRFFNELHEKISPRMFTNRPRDDGTIKFLFLNYDPTTKDDDNTKV